MARETPTVTVYFDTPAHDPLVFVLDDPVQGVLDDVYVLGGDLPTDVTAYVKSYSITRGRSRQLDDFVAGTARLVLNNQDRRFDPLHTAGPYYGNILPTKRITVAVEGVVIFDGVIDDWNFEWTVDGQALAYIEAVDCLGQLALMDYDEWTATPFQTAYNRLNEALDRPDVAFGANRNFDNGVSTMLGDLVTWGSNVLNYVQLIARSDLGRLFASRENVLTFHDRHYLLNATPTVTFADNGTGIPYQVVSTTYGSELLFNKVGIDRVDGDLQTANDADSQNAYGVRALSVAGLLVEDDIQSAGIAYYLLGLYKNPEFRISQVSVAVSTLSVANRALVLALDMADTVNVIFSPGVGSAISEIAVIEGISHEHTAGGVHLVTFAFGSVDARAFFVLDDDVFGVLDGTQVLAL